MNGTLKLKLPRYDSSDVSELKDAMAVYVEILNAMTRRLRIAEDQLAQARVSRDSWKAKYQALTKPKEKAPEESSGALVPNSGGV